jgi:DNA modification methylase
MITLINASAHDTGLDALSVHCIVTSPPYWGLRAYAGEQRIEWPAVEYSPMPGLPALSIPAMTCGLGEETTPEAYIGHLILVMRELWRVLRDDGTCWVNLGDSYASGGVTDPYRRTSSGKLMPPQGRAPVADGLKPKDLCLIPARFALAAQADGWYIRNDIIWAKPNPMPESVTDRCTKAHEYVWLMAKSQRYFYDAEAVKEEATDPEYRTVGRIRPTSDPLWSESATGNNRGGLHNQVEGRTTRNRRTVWNIATSPYSGAHFATWPPKLVEPMILAGTSPAASAPLVAVRGSGWWRRSGELAKRVILGPWQWGTVQPVQLL